MRRQPQPESRQVDVQPKGSWIVTSPPYYGMRTYIPDQWLRMWFLGGEPTVCYSSEKQITHGSPDEFAEQLRTVWRNVGTAAADDAKMVIRFGVSTTAKQIPCLSSSSRSRARAGS